MAGLAPPSTPHVGTLLADRYELVHHLARGGMGDVYEGVDRLLQRHVAVKVFRAAGPTDRTRFDAEVRVLAGLNHPGLVRVFDAGSHGDDAYVVLELVKGPSLAEALAERGRLPADEAARLGADLAAALEYIHDNGVVHRDVTPRNVLCDPAGRPRLVDFGIARLLESPRVTATATTIGTAAFMAPEQLQGTDVTPAADIYALGLVLLEVVAGRRAFEGAPHEAAAARLARDPDTTSDVPGAWQELLTEMTARDPATRPTAAEVRDRLLAVADNADLATGLVAVPDSADLATGPVAVAEGATVATAPVAVTSWGDETRPLAAADGGTAVMAAPVAPVDDPMDDVAERSARGARWALALGAVVAVLVAAVAAAASWSGNDPPMNVTTIPPASSTPTTAEEAPTATRPPTTTVPTTAAPTTAVPEVIPLEPVLPPQEDPGPDVTTDPGPSPVQPEQQESVPAGSP